MNNQDQQYVPPSAIQASNPDDAKVLHMAQTLYGEFAGVKDKDLQRQYMTMAASAAQNLFGKKEYSQDDWDTYLYKRFDAVANMNQPYKEALQGQFDTPQKQSAWKRAMQVAFGVKNGMIEKTPAEFYWTPQEYKTITKNGALPNPDQLTKVSSVGQYDTYRYKTQKDDKSAIQDQLKQQGYYDGKVDGVFGPMTKAAVRKFQEDNGLKVDGLVGKQTKDALFAK